MHCLRADAQLSCLPGSFDNTQDQAARRAHARALALAAQARFLVESNNTAERCGITALSVVRAGSISGVLDKRDSRSLKTWEWKRRFFVVAKTATGGVLFYFKHEQSTEPAEAVELSGKTGAARVSVEPSDDGGPQALRLELSNERTLLLRGGGGGGPGWSVAAMQRWVDALLGAGAEAESRGPLPHSLPGAMPSPSQSSAARSPDRTSQPAHSQATSQPASSRPCSRPSRRLSGEDAATACGITQDFLALSPFAPGQPRPGGTLTLHVAGGAGGGASELAARRRARCSRDAAEMQPRCGRDAGARCGRDADARASRLDLGSVAAAQARPHVARPAAARGALPDGERQRPRADRRGSRRPRRACGHR